MKLKKYTNNIQLTKYIANSGELNTKAVWNRDGIERDGAKFQIYLGVDSSKILYLHAISGFHEYISNSDYLLEEF